MIFIETSFFTEDVKRLLSDEEYGELQEHLAAHPHIGDVIKGTGGLRKARWTAGGKGKSGGVRIIYYHVTADSQIRMLAIYKKGVQDTLTAKQAELLRKINEGWNTHGR